MVLERSAKGKKAKAAFFHHFNDVDIYVEDTAIGTVKLYTILFSRALAGVFRVENVFPIGGRREVLGLCENDQEAGGRNRVYVIDGDLDLMTGRCAVTLRRLFVLPRYCIENYLIDEAAILSILDEDDVEKSLDAVSQHFAFDVWVKANESELFELFALYAMVHVICSEHNSVKFPVNRLFSEERGIVDPAKVKSRKESMEALLLERLTDDDLNKQKERIIQNVIDSGQDKLRFISAKHYLLPLVFERMRSITLLGSKNIVIKQRLARKCDASELKQVLDVLAGASDERSFR